MPPRSAVRGGQKWPSHLHPGRRDLDDLHQDSSQQESFSELRRGSSLPAYTPRPSLRLSHTHAFRDSRPRQADFCRYLSVPPVQSRTLGLACAETAPSLDLFPPRNHVDPHPIYDAAPAGDSTSQRRIPCSQISEPRLRPRPRGRRYAHSPKMRARAPPCPVSLRSKRNPGRV